MSSHTPEATPIILNVDDDPSVRTSTSWLLKANGFEVWDAATGCEALRLARHNPDLVVLDVVLPDQSGYEVCRRLKADPATSSTPVLMLSGLATSRRDEVAGMNGGADAYLTKPADPEVFVAHIRSLLRIRKAEEETRAARATAERHLVQMKAIIASMADGLIVATADGTLIDWNPKALQLHGFRSLDEVRRPHSTFANDFDLCIPDGDPLPIEAWPISRLLRGETLDELELHVRRRDNGQERYISYSGTPVRGPKGEIELAVLTIRDVTERRRTEEGLRRTAEMLRAVTDGTTDAVSLKDRDGRYLLVNPAAARFVGKSAEEIIGKDDSAIFDPNGFEAIREGDRRAIDTGVTETVEERRTASGTTRTYLTTRAPYRDMSGDVIGIIGVSRDVTKAKKAEAELRLRDRAIQAVSQGILITDPNLPGNPIIFASPGFERLTGYSAAEAVGQNCRFLQGPDTDPTAIADLRRAVEEGREASVELLNYRKDGTTFWNSLHIAPVKDGDKIVHFVGVQVDVTERRRLEERFRQSHKMEALGGLAGGIAHDFNNLLTIINGYSDVLLSTSNPDDPSHEHLLAIRNAGERSAGLTRQLLAVSRKQVLAPAIVDLNSVLSEMELILRRTLGEDIDLATRLHEKLGHVRVDAGQMGQVILNLGVNARDAMPVGGKLTIETRNAELDAEYSASHPGVKSGRYVVLTVTDTGCGMTEEVKRHIFEPFFTTKLPGKGTGLGLATVYGIVTQSGGSVEVYSEPGLGTSISVYLPRVNLPVSTIRRKPDIAPRPRGTETILLAEDDQSVRTLTSRVLRDAGYTVLEAGDGGEALRVAKSHTGLIHLLVTDVVMPGAGGRELAEHLCTSRPESRVLFLSGYTEDAVVRHGVLEEQVHFLQKPFSVPSLVQKVRAVLDVRPA